MPSRIFPGRPEQPDWNRIECLERNRIPNHAYLVQFPDQESCEQAIENNRRYLSPLIQMMTGTWDYKWFDSILQLPENIFAYRSGFDRIEVPSSRPIQINGQILNQSWPFVLDPPRVPEILPVAVYHRSVQLPGAWKGMRKKLVLQGVSSAFHLVLNGKLVGYAQNGRQLNEFDVTSLIHDGPNELFVLVYPYHAASYLDGHCLQNRVGFTGDIYVEATPALTVHDLKIHTRMDPQTDQWTLAIQATVHSYKVTTDLPEVRFTLSKDGEALFEQITRPDKIPMGDLGSDFKAQQAGIVNLHTVIPEISAWSDEQPELYDLFVTCLDPSGREVSCVQQIVGFCERTQVDGRFHLNHLPLVLNVCNYDPQDAHTGLTRPIGSLTRDLRLVKQHCNAIRLQGGSIDPLIYELCSHLGLLVITSLTAKPIQEWQENVLTSEAIPWLSDPWLSIQKDRLQRQISQLQNLPCILAWQTIPSETRVSDPLDEIIRSLDPTRPAIRFVRKREKEMRLHDRSVGVESSIQILDQGNRLDGGGSRHFLKDLTLPEDGHPCSGRILGAWKDVRQYLHSHRALTTCAALQAIRYDNRPVGIHSIDLKQGLFKLTNRTHSLLLDQFRLHWQVMASGQLIIAGEINLPPLMPGESGEMILPYVEAGYPEEQTCILQVTIHLIAANLWCPPDFIMSTESFYLPPFHEDRDPFLMQLPPVIQSGRNRLRLEHDRHLLVVSGHRFWLVFNRITAQIESWRCKDHEYLAFPPLHGQRTPSALAFWRSPLPQDQPWMQSWHDLGLDKMEQIVDRVEADCNGEQAHILADCRFGPAGMKPWLTVSMRTTIHENGKIDIHVSLSCRNESVLKEWPRLGLRFLLRRQYDTVTWSGQGPGPSWPDLRSMTYEGQFRQSLDSLIAEKCDLLTPEVPHDQTQWTALTDASGSGLLFESNQPFSFCVRDQIPVLKSGHKPDDRVMNQNLVYINIDWHYKPSGGQPETKLEKENFAEGQGTAEFYLSMMPVTGL